MTDKSYIQQNKEEKEEIFMIKIGTMISGVITIS